MISSLCANSNFEMFPKTHKCFNMILHVFSFILEIAFYKIKCTSINGISTRHSLTVEHLYRQHWALSCISKNRASWFTRVPVLQQLPPTVEQEGAAGPHEGWSGSWGQCRVFLANGSLSTWETRSPENELYVHFQQHWNKQPPQNSFPNPLVTPVNHQAEGGPPL